MVILQHTGGVISFFGNKSNPQHKSFGGILANIGRAIACVGWVLGGNVDNALIVAGASLVILVISFLIPKSTLPESPATEAKKSRSKSPKRE